MFRFLLAALFLFGTSFIPIAKKKVILAVFAHPDDEGAIAQLLTKYGKTHTVYLVIATDGRYGTKPGFPTGDSLVTLREQETSCACAKMELSAPCSCASLMDLIHVLGWASIFPNRKR